MIKRLKIFIDEVYYIFLKRRGIKKPILIFLTHLRLRFKRRFFELIGRKPSQEKILGMRVSFSDYGWFYHLWREVFILENYYFVSKNDKPFIVDAGSNIGMSILYFKLLYPNSEIMGFEPDPAAFKLLERNVQDNNLQGVELHNVALGLRDGEADFYQDLTIEASGINTLRKDMVVGKSKNIKVRIGRLSSFVGKKREIDLFKIDVEGAEYEILKEFGQGLLLVQTMILEVHQGRGLQNDPIPELLEILDKYNFRYGITQVFLSHHDFIADSSRSYAFMLDAARRNGKF